MMQVDSQIITAVLTFVGAAIISGIAYIMRTLIKQNEALAVLLTRVGTYDIGAMNSRVTALEADMVRVWNIRDSYHQPPNIPSATETLARTRI